MPKEVKLPPIRIVPLRLEDAHAPFFEYLTAQGRRVSTQRAYTTTYNRLLEAAGPKTYLHEIQPAHITAVFSHIAEDGQGVKNNTVSHLRGFFEWARIYRHVTPFDSEWPINSWRRKKYEVEQPPYVPAKEWPALLDAADKFHPVYRIAAALGLYLLARGPSEIGQLRLWDLDLHNWQVRVTRDKTRMAGDDMSICGELRVELMRWLRFYNTWAIQNRGMEVQREWYLLPRSNYNRRSIEDYVMYPTLPRAGNTYSRMATSILEEYGSPARGSHSFRRFGGRALYNALRDGGHSRDYALDVVRSMYGHKSRAMTEHYLNLQLDRETRNEAVVQHNGFMFEWNDPSQNMPTPLSVKQLPASLVGGVLLGGTSQKHLDAVEKDAQSLPGFLRKVA